MVPRQAEPGGALLLLLLLLMMLERVSLVDEGAERAAVGRSKGQDRRRGRPVVVKRAAERGRRREVGEGLDGGTTSATALGQVGVHAVVWMVRGRNERAGGGGFGWAWAWAKRETLDYPTMGFGDEHSSSGQDGTTGGAKEGRGCKLLGCVFTVKSTQKTADGTRCTAERGPATEPGEGARRCGCCSWSREDGGGSRITSSDRRLSATGWGVEVAAPAPTPTLPPSHQGAIPAPCLNCAATITT